MQHIPWEKIKSLQKEIDQLKSLNETHPSPGKKKGSKKRKDPLYGILKGVTFSEEEIDEAQKAIFNFKEIT